MSVKKLIGLFLSMVLLTTPVTFGASFKDLSSFKWAENAIINMTENGYINGFEDGTFRPEASITRAQLVSIINKMNNFTEEAPTTFSDVTSSHWAYKQIRIAVANGYVKGFEDGSFRPNALVTREQVAAIINNLYYLDNNTIRVSINDLSKISPWAVEAVVNVTARGIISLDENGNFYGKTPIKRVDSVFSLNNLLLHEVPTKIEWLAIKDSKENTSSVGSSTSGVLPPPSPLPTPIANDVISRLNTVLSRLNSRTIPSLTTSLQRETADIIVVSISAYIADQTYDTKNDVIAAKSKVAQMADSEYIAFKNAITSNILLSDLVALNDVFQLIEY